MKYKTNIELDKYSPSVLSNFLINEHPQTIALICSFLDDKKLVEVLRRMPEGLKAEIIIRMANLTSASEYMVSLIGDVIKSELQNLENDFELDGLSKVKNIINQLPKDEMQNTFSRIAEKDPDLIVELNIEIKQK